MNDFKGQIAPPILSLGGDFYDPVQPASFAKATPRFLNYQWAEKLHLPLKSDADWILHFAKFKPLPDNLSEPLALRYHGHQFHHYNPDLGDGRGFLFAQVLHENKLYDFGTKGSGQTPYSRSGDGRLTLKGAFREALATELLESLGVNTSKTFCFFETGESLIRHDEPSPTRAAVLTRLSHGHIRIGTFQRLAYLQQKENLQRLVKYVLQNYYPEENVSEDELLNAETLLLAFTQRLADMTASIMLGGFVHGVLNTDNINVSGEVFDYGPYRFLPHYDVHFTAAYFDQQGLYSYGNQPRSIFWNLQRFTEVLHWANPQLKFEPALESFSEALETRLIERLYSRLNLRPTEGQNGRLVMAKFFEFFEKTQAPFEQVLFDLYGVSLNPRWEKSPLAPLYQSAEGKALIASLQNYSPKQENLHPYFARHSPCTLLIDELESIWEPIARADDWSKFNKKIDDIRSFRGIY